MPAAPTQSVLVGLASILNIAGTKTADASTTTQNADNFLSLLNAGSNAHDNTDNAPARDSRDDKRDTPDPQAVAIDTPHLVEQKTAKTQQDDNNDNTQSVTDKTQTGSNDNIKPQTADKSDKSDVTDKTPVLKQASKDDASTPTDNTTAADNTSSDSNVDDIIAEEADLRDQLQKQLGKISDILLAFIQALTSGSQSSDATATTDATQNTSANNTTASELNLLMDIQSIVQQLQQALQAQGDASQTDLATQIQQLLQSHTGDPTIGTTQDPLMTLTDNLQQDIIKLAALFQQTDAQGNKIDPFANADASQVSDLKALLKASIGEAKGQLQKLRDLNEAIFAQARQNLQNSLSDAAASTAPATTATNNAPVTIAQQAATTTTLQITIQPLADASQFLAPQQAGVSQNGADNSGNNNSQNNQQQPQTVASPLSAGAAQAGAGATNATFARIMNQVNQASQGTVLDQVVFHVKNAVADGSSKIHIQLSPAELGKLEIKLDVDQDGKATVAITADNKSTLDLLQRDQQGLQRALADAGLTADSGSMNFNLNQQQDNSQNSSQAAQNYQSAQPDDESDIEINPTTRSYVVNLAEGLDIKI